MKVILISEALETPVEIDSTEERFHGQEWDFAYYVETQVKSLFNAEELRRNGHRVMD